MKKDIPVVELAQAGDYFKGSFHEHYFEGVIWSAGGCLLVGDTPIIESGVLRPAIHVESITRELPDLPTEPGTVFYATVRGVENVQLVLLSVNTRFPYRSVTPVESHWHASEQIDPESVQIVYTPGQEA